MSDDAIDLQITGRDLDLGEALQARVADAVEERIRKYFQRGFEARVAFSKMRHEVIAEATVHLASGVYLNAQGRAGDAHGAFDDVIEKLEKRVRRHKRRLKDHHAPNKDPLPAETAPSFLLAPFGESDDGETDGAGEAGGAPLVVAESVETLRTMTVSEAALQLDLTDLQAIVFRNAAHGGLNVVQRRADGNISWIDPGAKA
ncbi:MAG: ribosome-associated translation inhibitor RaiA [Pseudomonadota bacterium]